MHGLEAELAETYHQHASDLLRYAGGFLRCGDEARDAVQEAYLRYFVERQYGRQIDSPRAWLFQVVRNYCLDRLKAAVGRFEVQTEELDGASDHRTNPEERVQRSELAAEIAAALTGRELDCLRLRILGLRYDEVADAMGVRSGTVGAMLARVHKKLESYREKWASPGMAEAVCAFLAEGHSPRY
jgi:RNA polymerase sigma-70 factor (ECF subfamily)